MNKLLLIIQREYMSLVARKSFIVITILVPFLFIIIASIPVLTSKLNSASYGNCNRRNRPPVGRDFRQ